MIVLSVHQYKQRQIGEIVAWFQQHYHEEYMEYALFLGNHKGYLKWKLPRINKDWQYFDGLEIIITENL